MGLFKPSWMSKNEQKARAAVAAVSDQNALVQIVVSEKATHAARSAALQRITDQTLLGKAAVYVYREAEFTNTIARIDRTDVLDALEKAVIEASPEAASIKNRSVRFRYTVSDERVHAVRSKQAELRRLAEERAFQDRLAALNTDEKRVACIRELGGERVNEKLCLAALDAIKSKDCLQGLLGTVENLSRFVGKAVLRRLGYNNKQLYLTWRDRFLNSAEIDAFAAELTEDETLALVFDLARLKELKGNPHLNRAVAENGGCALVDELIAYMRKNYIGAEYNDTKLKKARWAADWLKVLYRAGKCADKIAVCQGERMKAHRDLPPVCTFPHEDTPAETFEL